MALGVDAKTENLVSVNVSMLTPRITEKNRKKKKWRKYYWVSGSWLMNWHVYAIWNTLNPCPPKPLDFCYKMPYTLVFARNV